jgi:hypothetical protein
MLEKGESYALPEWVWLLCYATVCIPTVLLSSIWDGQPPELEPCFRVFVFFFCGERLTHHPGYAFIASQFMMLRWRSALDPPTEYCSRIVDVLSLLVAVTVALEFLPFASGAVNRGLPRRSDPNLAFLFLASLAALAFCAALGSCSAFFLCCQIFFAGEVIVYLCPGSPLGKRVALLVLFAVIIGGLFTIFSEQFSSRKSLGRFAILLRCIPDDPASIVRTWIGAALLLLSANKPRPLQQFYVLSIIAGFLFISPPEFLQQEIDIRNITAKAFSDLALILSLAWPPQEHTWKILLTYGLSGFAFGFHSRMQ